MSDQDNQAKTNEKPPEPLADPLARGLRAANWWAGLAFALVFVMILTGMCRHLVAVGDLNFGVGTLGKIVAEIWWLILPVHRFGGYALIVLLPGSGMALLHLSTLLRGQEMRNSASVRRLGYAVLITGIAALLFEIVSGHMATQSREVWANFISTRQTPLPWMEGNPHDGREAFATHLLHLRAGSLALALPALALLASMFLVNRKQHK